ncbi:MAG: hypothetical protein COZ08_09360, partial [Bacteroidetes bacterium CG_4_10_14_3_um_filter_42_6]
TPGDVVQVILYRLSGEQELNQSFVSYDGQVISLILPETLKSGTYVYRVVSPTNTVAGKVVVIR